MFRGRPRGLLAVAVTVGLLAVAPGPVAADATPPQAPTAGVETSPVLPAGRTYTVTLLTGDVVTVHTGTARCPVVSVKPAGIGGVQRRSCGPDGHVRVIPGQVAGLIGATLDESLFDVTGLIQQGYDDTRTKDLPLIVRTAGSGAPGASARSADPLTARLRRPTALPSIGAVAGWQSKAAGPELLRDLSASRPAAPAQARTAPAAAKVWLDRRVRTTAAAPTPTEPTLTTTGLDANLRQVSAPQAWAAGFDGQGSRVAVLDTGADFTHPDLQGRIAEWADFNDPPGDGVDRHGHGTHVAATIAGTGAASAGQRRGVAPGARLVIGKVLDDEGYGSESAVIAGMQWAASRADVVNMSLGGWETNDGDDPMSQAVNALTEQYGTLFVLSAGNDGPYDGYVFAPAAAASALTVGAVDRTDTLAEFSSRGPLLSTWAAKPELVAPGVDIVAARAAGTGMGRIVDERYTASSGTSMAAPHVAGAAALLVQRHPDWNAAQLKAALVGAADPLPGADAYAVGSGRLNAARALHGVVSGQGLVNLGTLAYPQTGATTTGLSWTNTGTGPAAVVFTAAVTDRHGVAAAPGVATLSPRSAVIAAGATAEQALRVDQSRLAGAPGLYTAVVTARTVGGGFVASTTVVFHVEPPSHELTVGGTALPDTAAADDPYLFVQIANLDDVALFSRYVAFAPGETRTFRVPAGRYSVMGQLMEFGDRQRMALGGDPDVTVGSDTTVLVDAAHATPVSATVQGVATQASSVGILYVQTPRHGPSWTDFAFAWGETARAESVYAVPVADAGIGSFQAYSVFGLHAPGEPERSPFLYDLIEPLAGGIPQDLSHEVTAAERAGLARIDQRFHRLDMAGGGTGHKRYGFSPEGFFLAENSITGVGGDRADYISSGFAWLDEAFYDTLGDSGVVTQESLRRYAPGSKQQKVWVRQPLRPDWYDDPTPSTSGCVPTPPSRTRGSLHIELVDLADQHQRFDCLGWGDAWSYETVRSLTLHRDGVLVGTVPESFGDFAIGAAAADYRLTYDLDAATMLPVSTKVSTAWTFRSAAPAGTGSAPLPLLSVDYALPLDTANRPAGGTAGFTVRQAHGVAAQRVTAFRLWTSTDGGSTWTPVPVRSGTDGTYRAQLPDAAAGQAVSLRVKVDASAGSGFEQTVIDAYRNS
ncbi:S8 family serine peptidase [Catellatospora citrea]|uniref:Peptidase S8/S53 domain-containing protein n=1 Tax=Catellatospora citrea TaxID=53366 RepID=A0A8J3KQE8_9ACTN|nr:S8 family serine peptidase [Catellatospora citrea]RKE12041.1 subtilisin family serine protease [Catellatospora citrea]GIG02984.1 hypothetical protein Cci01nite_80770 [Catellatospora citrea]